MRPFDPRYGLTDQHRAKVLREAEMTSVSEAADYFRLHTSTIYRWRQRMAFAPGQVLSSGTLRPEDLIPCFASALGSFLPASLARDIRRWSAGGFEEYLVPFAEAEILEQLDEELQRLAPEGCYFGAHEGDGACFGFWELP